MVATRQNPPFQIYQDSVPPPPIPHNANKPRPQLQPSAMPLQPMRNPEQPYAEVMINPPMHMHHPHISPLKSQPISPQVPPYGNMGYVHIPAPLPGHPYTESPVKRPLMQQPSHHFTAPPPVPHSMFATFDSNLDFAPDNFQVPSTVNETYAEFPDPMYGRHQALKRSYSDATPTGERSGKRLRMDDERLPEPEDLPSVEDDGNKPQYSYAQMIGMAILRASNRQLTLAQIYDWISTTFAFYRDDPKQGWHNSIRHNLSLNKAFTKKERPKGDAGKGSYWIIEPGMEMQFLKDKQRKHNHVPGMTIHQSGSRTDIQVMAPPLAEALAPKPWSVQPTLPPRPQTAPALPELSSDATLPASDPALEEEEPADATLPSTAQPTSPAPVINSSPPVPISKHTRTISSPVRTRPASSRQHKRSATAMEDSGYWSELPSSHRKSNRNGIILTSELDIVASSSRKNLVRKQGGRAEDEIRRMRSSPRVPTPNAKGLEGLNYLDGSSSPVRHSPSVFVDPATPAVTFKKPLKPPNSVSPNSQLLFHRQAMGDFADSPIKRSGLEFGASTPLLKTPGVGMKSQFDEEFEMWQENNWLGRTPATPGLNSSPLKKSAKRPGSLLRTNTTTGVLSDVTNTHKLNARTPSRAPLLKPTAKSTLAGSPLKTTMLPPFEAYDDFLNFGDENVSNSFDGNSDGEGLDLSQGFGKIGALASTAGRPGLGPRSHTTGF